MIDRMIEHPYPSPEPTEPLASRLPVAAERVGVSISTLRRWIRNGWLPTVQINGVVLVLEDDLRAFIEHQRS